MLALPALFAAALLSAPPSSIPVRALEPASFTAQPGNPLTFRVTDDSGPLPWAGLQVDWMFVRIAATQRNMDEPPTDARGEMAITFPESGAGIVGIDFTARQATVPAADLREFATARAMPGSALPEGDANVRLRRIESVKAIVRSGEPGPAVESVATSKTGQQVEIRALMDAAATPSGGDIALRAYVNGAFMPGARLTATHIASAKQTDIRCDAMGIGNLTITAPGAWRIELHHLRRVDEQWTLYSATLTFETPDAGPPEQEDGAP
jgi:hypothetical protein